VKKHRTAKTAGQSEDAIEALEEILGSLRITEDNMSNRSTKPAIPEIDRMLTAPVPAVYNESVPTKTMVPDPGWFDGDKIKFKDWWRGISLFLKSNRVVVADERITAMLAQLRGGIAEIYAQKKIDELEDTNDTQSWEEFVKEIKTAFSDKSKAADAKWKIETFKQGRKYIVDFMIEFEVLVMKIEIDNLHMIFLLKKNVQTDIIKTILGYLLMAAPDILKEWKVAITVVGQEYKSTESQHDYKTSTRTTFGERGSPIDIGKSRNNFDENRKPRCFNCNLYRHLAKECRRSKKEREMRKCYKCDKQRHLAKDCKSKQLMKNRRIKEDNSEDEKEEGFVEGLE